MTRFGKVLVVVLAITIYLLSMSGWFTLGYIAYLNSTKPSPPTLAPCGPSTSTRP